MVIQNAALQLALNKPKFSNITLMIWVKSISYHEACHQTPIYLKVNSHWASSRTRSRIRDPLRQDPFEQLRVKKNSQPPLSNPKLGPPLIHHKLHVFDFPEFCMFFTCPPGFHPSSYTDTQIGKLATLNWCLLCVVMKCFLVQVIFLP